MKIFHKSETVVAVFDIGSSSVSGALVSLRNGERPEVHDMQHSRIVLQEKLNHKRFFSSMLSSFDDVSKKILGKAGEDIVDEVHCFFSSPWYASKYAEVSIKKDEAFMITDDLIETALDNEVSAFEAAQQKIYADTDLGSPELIEKESMRLRMNGYEVSDIKKKWAKQADVAYMASVVPAKVLASLSDKIESRFNERRVHFHTFPFASYVAIRDHELSHSNSFLLLDITGEITDILLIENDVMIKSDTFPFGTNFIFRHIAEALHTDMSEAHSLLSMYRDGKVEEKRTEVIEKTLMSCQNEWKKQFSETFSHFSRGGAATRNIFFACDEDVSDWFGELLRGKVISRAPKDGVDLKKPKVQYIGGALAKNLCNFKQKGKEQAFLGIEAAFLLRFQNRKTV